MDRELEAIGLFGDPRVRYFAAIRPDEPGAFSSVGARGVYLSQLEILREAEEAGESVLILEDDCEFFPEAANYLTTEEWEMFYGGYYADDPHDLFDSDISGAHMMGFSRRGVQRVLDFLRKLDPGTEIHPPIDAAYVWFRRANPEVAVHFAVPKLAMQRSSKSDIAPVKWHHHLPLGRRAGKFVRAFSRKMRGE